MANTTIYLVRHGQTEWNLENKLQGHMDSPLTDVGRIQAISLRERLKNVKLDAAYSSTSLRAVSTAKLILAGRQEKIIRLDDLKEINMGLWEGQEIKNIQSENPQNFARFFSEPHLYMPTGRGETYLQLLNRVVPAVERIISTNVGKAILIVTHRITLKTILNYYLRNRLDDLGKIPDISPASLSIITIKNDIPFISLYEDTSHYEEKMVIQGGE